MAAARDGLGANRLSSEAEPRNRKHVRALRPASHYVVLPRLRRGSRLDGEKLDSIDKQFGPSRLLGEMWTSKCARPRRRSWTGNLINHRCGSLARRRLTRLSRFGRPEGTREAELLTPARMALRLRIGPLGRQRTQFGENWRDGRGIPIAFPMLPRSGMIPERTVLLVSPTSQLSRAVAPLLRSAGYQVTLARSFQSARTHLDAAPDLVITELKLGEYNGLQLALRGRAIGTPFIVLADESFEHEVEHLGAVWMSPQSASSDEIQIVIARLLERARYIESPCAWSQSDTEEIVPVGPSQARMSRYLH